MLDRERGQLTRLGWVPPPAAHQDCRPPSCLTLTTTSAKIRRYVRVRELSAGRADLAILHRATDRLPTAVGGS